MAKRGPMPTFETVADYIAAQPPEVQSALNTLRALILEAAPEATELINYKIPAYALVPGGKRDQQLMMAGHSKFVGFYPFPTTMAAFSEALKDYKQGKGSVQFPLDQPLPKELITRMVRFRQQELQQQKK
ncbi:iron chaperone [Altibacter sp. HG106]|uniref:iron chaperone n=1 Tax=Altibacter sp. HG106 TaxID=3023937 RepID=UPI00235103B1|nr:DUF1801 domain-containing protein [Altibacter sp. HG106]MDC7995659.1 DUF1801 domain-containing protein [Altibacter sp. HG106]